MKQTEIGMIPDDWEVKKLKETVTFLDSKRIPITESDRKKGIYPYYGASGIIDYVDKYIFDGEYILLGEDGANIIDRSSRLAFVVKGKCWINNHAHVLEAKHNYDAFYLAELLESYNYESLNTGTAQPKLNRNKCENILVILPPTLAEQQTIAKALSDVDNVISTLEKLITKKKNLKQGTMQRLLTGKKRLPGFAKSNKFKQTEIGEIPEDWEVKELHELCDLLNGDRGINYPKDSDMVSNGIPFINAGHLQNGVIDLDNMDYISDSHYQKLSGAKIRTNDILFCLRGSLGKNAISNFGNGAPASSLCVIRAKKINHFYLFQLINSVIFEKQIEDVNTGSSQPNLSAKDVSNFLIPIPMDCVEQTAIANVLSSMDKEIEALNTKLEKYRNLKTGMMQQLLTGKIRLV